MIQTPSDHGTAQIMANKAARNWHWHWLPRSWTANGEKKIRSKQTHYLIMQTSYEDQHMWHCSSAVKILKKKWRAAIITCSKSDIAIPTNDLCAI